MERATPDISQLPKSVRVFASAENRNVARRLEGHEQGEWYTSHQILPWRPFSCDFASLPEQENREFTPRHELSTRISVRFRNHPTPSPMAV